MNVMATPGIEIRTGQPTRSLYASYWFSIAIIPYVHEQALSTLNLSCGSMCHAWRPGCGAACQHSTRSLTVAHMA